MYGQTDWSQQKEIKCVVKILFLHERTGMRSRQKSKYLREHDHKVINPALPDDDFDESIRIAEDRYDKHHPDVIIGSSRGGAVAVNMSSGDTPIVLLCPAWKKWGSATTVHSNTIILHSWQDDVIPFADSEELVANSNLPPESLINVGIDHRLADPVPLEAMLKACIGECVRPVDDHNWTLSYLMYLTRAVETDVDSETGRSYQVPQLAKMEQLLMDADCHLQRLARTLEERNVSWFTVGANVTLEVIERVLNLLCRESGIQDSAAAARLRIAEACTLLETNLTLSDLEITQSNGELSEPPLRRAGILAPVLPASDQSIDESAKVVECSPLEPDGADERSDIRWDSGRRDLYLNDALVRHFSFQVGEKVFAILNAFTEDGWPKHLDLPIDRDDVRHALRTINRNLKRLRFRQDGEQIKWEEVSVK